MTAKIARITIDADKTTDDEIFAAVHEAKQDGATFFAFTFADDPNPVSLDDLTSIATQLDRISELDEMFEDFGSPPNVH
jgi:hypothetical protein